jgi:hypothetical protein
LICLAIIGGLMAVTGGAMTVRVFGVVAGAAFLLGAVFIATYGVTIDEQAGAVTISTAFRTKAFRQAHTSASAQRRLKSIYGTTSVYVRLRDGDVSTAIQLSPFAREDQRTLLRAFRLDPNL